MCPPLHYYLTMCLRAKQLTVSVFIQVTLRRMVYLVIKEMAEIAEDVIIVTSSLTKDMTGKEDQFRGPAIRALCKITDVSSGALMNVLY